MTKAQPSAAETRSTRWMPTGRKAFQIALWYAAVGALWISFSGWALHTLVPNAVVAGVLEDLKGWGFVVVTATLLGWQLDRYFRAIRRSAELLQESENRLHLIGDNLPDGYIFEFSHPADGRPQFTYLSAGVERVHGVAPAEVLRNAECLLGQVDPSQRPWLTAAEAESARQMTDFHMDLRIRRADGASRIIRLRSHPCRHPDGGIRWEGIAVDTTERRQAEEALEQSEQKYREIFNATNEAIFVHEAGTGRVLDVNETMLRLYGYASKAEVLGELTAAPADPFYNKFEARVRINQALEHGPQTFEWLTRKKNGEFFWVEVSLRAAQMGGETRVLAVVRDISERKRTDQALRESLALLETMGGMAHVGGWELDPVTGQGQWTEEVARIHDVEPSVRPNKEMGLALYTPESRPIIAAAVREAIEHGTPYDLELEILSAKGVRKWIRTICRPVVERGKVNRLRGSLQDITARKHAEAAVQESERLLRTVMDLVPHFIFAKDRQGRYVFVNRAMAAANRMTPEQMVGQCDLDYLPDQDEARAFMRSDREVIDSEQPRVIPEDRFTDASGQTHILQTTKVPFSFPGAGLVVVGVAVDITDLKRAEAAVRQSESEFRAMFETATIGMAQADAETGQWVRVNDRMCAITGYSREEMLQLCIPMITHPEDRERDWDLYRRVIAGEAREYRIEKRYLCKNGAVAWVHVNMTVLRDPAGRPLHTLATIEDITERKQAEDRLRQLSRAVEQSSVSIVITDMRGAIEYVNPKFCQTTGYTFEEVFGQNPRVLKSGEMPPEDYARLWQTILAGKEWRGEFHNRKKNGELYWELASISPITDRQGNLTHFVAVKEDITQRRQLEAQLRQAQKLEAVAQLAGGIAHDFNNILTAMLMQLGLLREEPGLAPAIREGLKDLDTAAQRATNLTRQMLMFSRRSVLDIKVLDLNALVENLLKMLRRAIGEHFEVSFQPEGGVLAVKADSSMLEQVLMNLAVNARDAMPAGGQILIRTSAVTLGEAPLGAPAGGRVGRFVCLSLGDTGCGMDAATLKRLFEPFFTTKGPGKGTGLGLATVHGIVGQHQGWVEVESAVGRGSTFRVFLPVVDAPVENRATHPALPLTAFPGTETILLVEDELAVRRNLGQLLRLLGYRLLLAADGHEAIALWQKEKAGIDLLFADMMMPGGITGLALAEQFQAEKPGLKVIISSGYSHETAHPSPPGRVQAAYLPKPYDARTLAMTLRSCLAPPAGKP